MDNPLINSNNGGNPMNSDMQYPPPSIGDKNDNVQMDTSGYMGDKIDVYDAHTQGQGDIGLNYQKHVAHPNVGYEQQNPADYILQSGSGFSLVTTESAVSATVGDVNVYTNAQTDISYDSTPSNNVTSSESLVGVTSTVNPPSYVESNPIDQNNFVSQYIQEAQAGSQFQIAANESYAVPISQPVQESPMVGETHDQPKETAVTDNTDVNNVGTEEHANNEKMETVPSEDASQTCNNDPCDNIDSSQLGETTEMTLEQDNSLKTNAEITENLENAQENPDDKKENPDDKKENPDHKKEDPDHKRENPDNTQGNPDQTQKNPDQPQENSDQTQENPDQTQENVGNTQENPINSVATQSQQDIEELNEKTAEVPVDEQTPLSQDVTDSSVTEELQPEPNEVATEDKPVKEVEEMIADPPQNDVEMLDISLQSLDASNDSGASVELLEDTTEPPVVILDHSDESTEEVLNQSEQSVDNVIEEEAQEVCEEAPPIEEESSAEQSAIVKETVQQQISGEQVIVGQHEEGGEEGIADGQQGEEAIADHQQGEELIVEHHQGEEVIADHQAPEEVIVDNQGSEKMNVDHQAEDVIVQEEAQVGKVAIDPLAQAVSNAQLNDYEPTPIDQADKSAIEDTPEPKTPNIDVPATNDPQTIEHDSEIPQTVSNTIIYENYETKVEGRSRNTSKTPQINALINQTLQNYCIPEEIEVTTVTEEHLIDDYEDEIQVSNNDERTEVVVIQCYDDSESVNADDPVDEEIPKSEKMKNKRVMRAMTRRIQAGAQAVPPHVLGVDIKSPVDAYNGKKPRLGVKIPCKNLQSQIVTKEELQKEIMDRCRVKQEQKGDRFARTLTSRLAKKLGANPASKPKAPATNNNKNDDDNSDLIAILEGSDPPQDETPKREPITTQTASNQPTEAEENLKMLEREIALQQLQEFPLWSPKVRYIPKGGFNQKPQTTQVIKEEATAQKTPVVAKEKSTNPIKSPEPKKAAVTTKLDNGNKQKSTTIEIDLPEQVEDPLDVEPQVKVNMVLKTYSRKRKSADSESIPDNPSPTKKVAIIKSDSAINPNLGKTVRKDDVYVTKSSRIIKKKVIWDPDEASSRFAAKSKIDLPVATPPKPSKSSEDVVKSSEKKPDKKIELKTEKKTEVKPEKKPEVKPEKKPDPKPEKKPDSKTESTTKKVSDKPSVNNSAEAKKLIVSKKLKSPVHKKRLTEIDKLLMDEGAVNMLYDVKNTEEALEKRKKTLMSSAKANKEMIKRANEIKNDLHQSTVSESPKSLRKKESIATPSPPPKPQPVAEPLAKKKQSKELKAAAQATPPASPGFTAYQESSRLIRRRSSSSISSASEIENEDGGKISKRKSGDVSKAKKAKKAAKEKEEAEEKSAAAKKQTENVAERSSQYKTFKFKKTNKLVSLEFKYVDDKCLFTVQMLKEMIAVLKQLSKDKDCNVVSITSSSNAFCHGLDYRFLVAESIESRTKKAKELSGYVEDFLKCLLYFPKVLVAGIQGDCIGLGVTMLPLFDIVIASDSATFSTPYAELGSMAEGGFLLSPPFQSNKGLASELLYTGNKINADDATRRGLITRVCWPEKYQDELKVLLSSIAKGSRRSLEANKQQVNSFLINTAKAAISSEISMLTEHWMSDECQKKFSVLA